MEQIIDLEVDHLFLIFEDEAGEPVYWPAADIPTIGMPIDGVSGFDLELVGACIYNQTVQLQ